MSANKKGRPKTTITELMATEDIDELREALFPPPPSELRPDTIEIQERLRVADMLIPGSPLGPRFLDQYRHIKQPLLSNAFGRTASLSGHGNLILVTSSIPGEGKTYTAVNLALSIAQEQDHTVLFVDCDVSGKGASRMFDIHYRPGLIDVLENHEISIGNVLLRTDVTALSVISAGKDHQNATELLASKRMLAVVDEIVRRYDDRVIIFDAPPVLSTPQTSVLAGLTGQVVFVIEAGKTARSVVERALEMLPQDKAIGLVLNKAEGLTGDSGYYYSYYETGTGKSGN